MSYQESHSALSPGSAHRTSEIRDGTDELHHALRAHLDRNFDKFELYALKNVLKVPDSVAKQLDDVEQQSRHSAASFTDFTATEEEEARLRDSISALQSAVIEVTLVVLLHGYIILS